MLIRQPGLLPLDAAAPGCVLAFSPVGRRPLPAAASAIVAALRTQVFSGVCECHHAAAPGAGGEFRLGVGLLSHVEPLPAELWAERLGRPPRGWWSRFVEAVALACAAGDQVRLIPAWCGSEPIGMLRAMSRHVGTAGLEAGAPTWVSDADAALGGGSLFTFACRRASA